MARARSISSSQSHGRRAYQGPQPQAQSDAKALPYYLASFQILLARLTGSAEIVIGVADSNRSTLTDQATMGYFTNLLPARLPYDPDKIFHEAKEQMRGALLHGAVPYGALLDHLGLAPAVFPRRALARAVVPGRVRLQAKPGGKRKHRGCQDRRLAHPARRITLRHHA